MPESSRPPLAKALLPWDFSPASASSSPASSRTGRSPTASPAPAAAKAPSSPSATRASASRSASPNSPPSSARPWSSTATSPTTPRSTPCSPRLGEAWPTFDGFVHSIGYAPKEAIAGDFLEGLSREAFRIAHDISSYSFPALAKAAAPRLEPGSRAPHPDLSGGAAQRSQLQHDGPGQGVARGQRALPGGQPRPEGRPRQRHLGRADQDAGRLGHQGLRQDPRRRRRERAAAPQRDDRRRRQRRRVPALRPGLPA